MAKFDELYNLINTNDAVIESTRLSREINKRSKTNPNLDSVDSLRFGKELASMSDKELDDMFDGEERGRVFKRKIDDEYKKELIENDPKHDLRHALGGLGGTKIKRNQRDTFKTSNSRSSVDEKQRIKDKYKNYNGRDFSDKPGPYNWYGIDLKASEMKDKIKKNIKEMKNRKWAKESVEDIKLTIYESCREGYITEEEQDFLLESMRSLSISSGENKIDENNLNSSKNVDLKKLVKDTFKSTTGDKYSIVMSDLNKLNISDNDIFECLIGKGSSDRLKTGQDLTKILDKYFDNKGKLMINDMIDKVRND